MAKSRAVWGIDIGNCSLKALRLRLSSEPNQVVADAFDYIEYPKILTQPGTEPGELIQDALKQFLSRNSVRGDRVAISVSGQSGLARFVKLPPVEAKKIPDIVRFEARQQIPFDLQDVVWDYQRMGGGAEEEGFVLETEIGLFAMKRDQVMRALQPFNVAGIPVDFVQLTPLSLYNYVAFDFLQDLPPPEQYNPDEPPASIVILSLGTDATDLVVTNGFRVWQRSIPLGGNHFTKALTKELKLTFAKAEHLKRNATAAEDPKAVFQAMRPVFNDLLTEVQRSIGYFTSIDRAAKIERVLALGNAMKLPGLRRYLSQSLGFEVMRIESFSRMSGAEVTGAPAFQENLLCFGGCYGLAVQGLGLGSLRTNLLPKEITRERVIRQKKPWVVAAAALLLLAFAFSFGSYSLALARLDKSVFDTAERAANTAVAEAGEFKKGATAETGKYKATDAIGEHLVSNVEGRIRWLEVLRAINACLPTDPEGSVSDEPEDIPRRNRLYIQSVECQWVDDLSAWYQSHPQDAFYQPPGDENAAAAASGQTGPSAPEAASPPSAAATPRRSGGFFGFGGGTKSATSTPAVRVQPAAVTRGLSGPGWVFILKGYHVHNVNEPGTLKGPFYVRKTLLAELHSKKVQLPTPDGQGVEEVSLKELGIGYPLLVGVNAIVDWPVVNPFPTVVETVSPAQPGTPRSASGIQGAGAGQLAPPILGAQPADTVHLYRYDFVAQFCWQPTPPSKRHEKETAPPGGAVPPRPKVPLTPVAQAGQPPP
jgi:type IV pilus assembly protein PilM